MTIEKPTHQIAWTFTIGFILAMLLPRLAGEGLFGDGLIYASIARNMAIGNGSYWAPFFSSSYYIPYNQGSIFYEQPPLMMGIESIFFRLFGDYYFTEKIYCFAVTFITVWLIHKIWILFFDSHDTVKPFGWVAVLLWYTMPTVIWGMANNMLDCTMAIFSLSSAYFFIKYQRSMHYKYIIFGAFILVLVFLSKGPVGLFPLTIPFLYALVFNKHKWWMGMTHSAAIVCLFFILFGLLLLYVPARTFIFEYFNQQVVLAIQGGREDGGLAWHHRFDIVINLFSIQLLPPILLTGSIYLIFRFAYKIEINESKYFAPALFFSLVGLSGSVPMCVSLKQSSFYLIPSTPFFAIAIAIFILPLVLKINEILSFSKQWKIILQYAFTIGIAIIFVYSFSLFNTITRDQHIIVPLKSILTIVPKGQKLYTCEYAMNSFELHSYFQRYGRYEFTNKQDDANYTFICKECDEVFKSNFLKVLPIFKSDNYLIFQNSVASARSKK